MLVCFFLFIFEQIVFVSYKINDEMSKWTMWRTRWNQSRFKSVSSIECRHTYVSILFYCVLYVVFFLCSAPCVLSIANYLSNSIDHFTYIEQRKKQHVPMLMTLTTDTRHSNADTSDSSERYWAKSNKMFWIQNYHEWQQAEREWKKPNLIRKFSRRSTQARLNHSHSIIKNCELWFGGFLPWKAYDDNGNNNNNNNNSNKNKIVLLIFSEDIITAH